MTTRKGKYADVVARLPRQLEEPTYQEKVSLTKAKILELWENEEVGPPTAAGLAREYEKLRNSKTEVEDELGKVQLQLTAIEQLLVDQYEVEGVSSVKLADGSYVGVQFEPTAQVVDRTAVRMWAIANGYEELLTLAWSSLNSITKDLLLNGQPEPDGVKASTRVKFVLRRG